MIEILDKKQLSPSYFLLKTDIAQPSLPGQFYMLGSDDKSKLLGRPISVFDYDKKTTSFLVAQVGEGTKNLAQLEVGDQIQGSGPYGNGFPQILNRKIGLVGGGTGVAPFHFLARRYGDREDMDFTLYLGFNEDQGLEDLFSGLASPVHFKYGGLITDSVDFDGLDMFFTCGPRPMMEAVQREGKKRDKHVYLSLETRMGCGFGACLSCSIRTKQGRKKVCLDGPVFSGDLLIWEN
ncbi:MAG: dihydroorotate dehydrogenase electron transfer subunit [Tissierellia bacterium]|nr:dihydroorotate dehydrogenase electron transfer subunit [Tissierellia bacterium]